MGWIGLGLIPNPALRHDLRNPLRVAGIEIPPAFEDFEHIFVVGQPDQRGALGAEFCDIKRRVEGPLLRIPPLKIAANAIPAPRRHIAVVIIKRRAAVGEKRGGHEGSVAPDGCCVQRRILIGGIGLGYAADGRAIAECRVSGSDEHRFLELATGSNNDTRPEFSATDARGA